MRLKSRIIKPFAKRTARRVAQMAETAVQDQQAMLLQHIRRSVKTVFGRDHHFNELEDYDSYKSAVPIRDYEALRPYMDRVIGGESDILWPGRPRYFATTSGTTSGMKYIPITSDSLPNHFHSARNAVFCQVVRHDSYQIFDGNMIFLSGSPALTTTAGIPTGRLSGIVNHAVPAWLRSNQLPTYDVNCIDDWDEKISGIIRETRDRPMTLISGIPPWVKDYMERLLEETKVETIGELFPSLRCLAHGGVNYQPYQAAFHRLIGRPVQMIETYPASEGFIAYQDRGTDDGLLLNTRSGIFFEFVPMDEMDKPEPIRLPLHEVEVDTPYALLLTTNAGLWSYAIGDLVSFTSVDPYRLRVVGRTKHYVSAFGEHVIADEIEKAITILSERMGLRVAAFTVGPHIGGDGESSYHQWVIELGEELDWPEDVVTLIDQTLREQNSYYDDLRTSQMLSMPKVSIVKEGSFARYMASIGKLGGQNKVPIVTNSPDVVQGVLEVGG